MPVTLSAPPTLLGPSRTEAELFPVTWSPGPNDAVGGDRAAAEPAEKGEGADKTPTVEERRGDRYALQGLLGKGGMGEVWRVWDPSLRRSLAMKVLVERAQQDSVALARFVEEAEATAQLAHPGIVPVHELGRLPDGRPYFTMREIAGHTLAEVLAEGPTLRRKIELLHRVAETLAYAHSRGVVHRDLKPQNVMIGPFGEVLVLDWGLVKITEFADVETLRSTTDEGQTRYGAIAGTPAYMSPEQARGRAASITPATDCWALGVLLYEMLAGQTPVIASSTAQVLHRVARGQLDPLPLGIDPTLSALCTFALAVDPDQRPTDASVFVTELRRWLDGADRRDRALRLVLASDDLGVQVDRLESEARSLRAEAATRLGALPPWAPVAEKKVGWDLETQAASLEQEAALARVDCMQRLRGALNEAPELPEAQARLADHYRLAHERAETEGDRAAAIESLSLLLAHDRGAHSAYLKGEGALTLIPGSPDTRIRLYRVVEEDRRLVPQFDRELPPGPVQELSLPIGSWLALIEAPDHSPVQYPFYLGRLEHWNGVPPGDSAPRPIYQPRLQDVPPGACFVPAGWMKTGRPGARQDNHRPPARVWVEDLWIDRHPVTNREYIRFLDDLVYQGREEEAIRHVPRGVFELRGADTLIYGRRADGGFQPVPDPEGTLWELDWPVLMVNFADALAYAEWRAQRSGLLWRLPHELEREKAGRGADGRLLPWGDFMDATWCRVRSSEEGRVGPVSVNAVPADESVYGVRGLVGNALDWCINPFVAGHPGVENGGRLCVDDTPSAALPEARRSCRGGSWMFHAGLCSLDARWSWEPSARRPDASFRLLSPVR